MKRFLFVALSICALYSCKKEKATQHVLSDSSMYISSHVYRDSGLRVFTHNGEIFDEDIIANFFAAHPDFFSRDDAAERERDSIRVLSTEAVILRRYEDFREYTVTYSGNSIKFSMKDSAERLVAELTPPGFQAEIDGILDGLLQREYTKKQSLNPYVGTGYRYCIWENEYAAFQEGIIRQELSFYYGAFYYSKSGISIKTEQQVAATMRANPVSQLGLYDTVVIQGGYREYIPQ